MSDFVWENEEEPKIEVDEKEIKEQELQEIEEDTWFQQIIKVLVYKSNLTTHQLINRGLFVLVISLVMYIVYYYVAPINQVDVINVNQTTFVSKSEIISMTGLEIEKKYSLVDLYFRTDNVDSESFSNVNGKYDPATNAFNVTIEELKPLAIDSTGNFYYLDNNGIQMTTEMAFDAPKLIGFEKEILEKVIKELSGLDYNIIKEIAAVELNATEISSELVLMTMTDGNYVEININQIDEKMPYYLQMQAIINSDNKGKDGILHLNIGDFYEPL